MKSFAEIQTETHDNLMEMLAREAFKQKECFLLAPSQAALIPCNANGQTPAGQVQIQIQRDGDFILEKIAIFAKGPVNRNGYSPSGAIGANEVQTVFPSGMRSASNRDLADSGLTVQVTDTGSGVKWFDGFMDLPSFATPGYSGILYEVFPVRQYMNAGNALAFDFRNKDIATLDSTVSDPSSASCLFHYVSIALFGSKFNGAGLNT